MFEAYSVGIKISLQNLVSPQLALLSKEFEKLDLLVVNLKQSLGKISVDSAGMKGLTSAANATNRAFERAALSAASFQRQLASIHGMGAPMLPGGGGRGGGGGGRSPGGFHGGNIHLGAGGVGLGTVGMATGDWFWPLAASGAAVYAGKSLFDSARALDTEQQRFKLLGMSDAQNNEAFKYVEGMRIYGTTQVERLSAFREAQGVGRESGLQGSSALEFAKQATPVLAKLDALGVALDDVSKAALHTSNIALLRFDEQAGGLKNPVEFHRLANIGYKLRQSSGDTIDFEQLRAVTSKGGAYTQNKSEQGWAYAEPIIQEVKGNAYGVGVATAGARLFNVMSKTPKNLVDLAIKFGLWTKDRQHLSEEDSRLFKENFEKFYIERMMPLYEKFKQSPNDRVRDNSIFLGRTGGNLGNLIEKQIPSIERSWDAYQKSKSIDEATKQLPDSISAQMKEFDSAWTDFKTQWGTTMLPFFSGILKAGSALLRPADSNTAWYTNVAKGMLNPVGALIHSGGESPHFVSRQSGFHGTVHTTTTINLDGQKMASVVSKHQGNAASAPQTGIGGFDSRLSPMPAGGQ